VRVNIKHSVSNVYIAIDKTATRFLIFTAFFRIKWTTVVIGIDDHY